MYWAVPYSSLYPTPHQCLAPRSTFELLHPPCYTIPTPDTQDTNLPSCTAPALYGLVQSQNVITRFTYPKTKSKSACEPISQRTQSQQYAYVVRLAEDRDDRLRRRSRDLLDAVRVGAVLASTVAAVVVPKPRYRGEGVGRNYVDRCGRPGARVAGDRVRERDVDSGTVLPIDAAQSWQRSNEHAENGRLSMSGIPV